MVRESTVFGRFPVASVSRDGMRLDWGVFRRSITGPIRLLLDHDPTRSVATTHDRSLAVATAPNGDCVLRVHLPQNRLGRELFEHLQADDYRGISFGYESAEFMAGIVYQLIGLCEFSLMRNPWGPMFPGTFVLLFEGHRTDWLGWLK